MFITPAPHPQIRLLSTRRKLKALSLPPSLSCRPPPSTCGRGESPRESPLSHRLKGAFRGYLPQPHDATAAAHARSRGKYGDGARGGRILQHVLRRHRHHLRPKRREDAKERDPSLPFPLPIRLNEDASPTTQGGAAHDRLDRLDRGMTDCRVDWSWRTRTAIPGFHGGKSSESYKTFLT